MNEIISAWLPDEKSTEYFRVCIFVWFGKKQKRTENSFRLILPVVREEGGLTADESTVLRLL